MKRILIKVVTGIAFVVSMVALFFAVKKIREKAENTVRDLEVQKGIQYSQKEFLKKTEEIMMGVMEATSDEIQERWLRRFGLD